MRERITLKVCIALIAALLGVGMTSEKAQSYDVSAIRGQWVYESVAAFDGNEEVAIDLESLCCEMPAEMDIRYDDVSFVWKDRTQTVKLSAVARGQSLCFSVCGTWKKVDDKVQFSWDMDLEGPAPKAITIVLTYKPK